MHRRMFMALLAIGIAGCASMRGVNVGTDKPAGGSYSVSVHNTRSSSIVVYWIDGAGSHEIGSVPAGGTRTLTVRSPSSLSGSVRAATSSGSPISTKSVTLSATSTKSVSF